MRIWSVLILLFTGFWYNHYFGWNTHPKNDAEIICDMLYAIMGLLYWAANLLADIHTQLLKQHEYPTSTDEKSK